VGGATQVSVILDIVLHIGEVVVTSCTVVRLFSATDRMYLADV
jgi:hypothetical protein